MEIDLNMDDDEEDVLTLIIKYTEILDEFSRKSVKKIKGLIPFIFYISTILK